MEDIMKVNDIIVLDNDDKYILLKEIIKDDITYYFAAGVDEKENIDQKKLVILKLIFDKDGNYIEIVEDEKMLQTLVEEFKDTFK